MVSAHRAMSSTGEAISPKHDRVANLDRALRFRDIDGQHIHGHSSGETRSFPVDQYGRSGCGAARIAIAIADRRDRQARRARRGPVASIADLLPFREILDRDHARTQGHDRPQAMIRAGRASERRDAIQNQAGSHPVGMRVRKARSPAELTTLRSPASERVAAQTPSIVPRSWATPANRRTRDGCTGESALAHKATRSRRHALRETRRP